MQVLGSAGGLQNWLQEKLKEALNTVPASCAASVRSNEKAKSDAEKVWVMT
jgi:hypothetical protein